MKKRRPRSIGAMPKLAVLGQPISHSRSPAIHNAALEELGLAPEWSYEAIELSPEEFEDRVRAMPAEGFAGANVTIPHKLAALRVADSASDAAGEIGAANTLSFTDGAIAADNTDATGFLEALPGSPSGMRAVVLGAGGAARAVIWALLRAGAEVAVWNRTQARGEELALEMGATPIPSEDQVPAAGYELLVNTTSVGLAGPDPAGADDLKALHVDADALNETHTVVDLVYGPDETPLATAARRRGARVVDGLDVLVHQGAASLRIWTGMDPPIETMRRAARR
jgi:shikimate dehydrogenase